MNANEYAKIQFFTPLEKYDYFQQEYGQIYGWISGGDRPFLADLLPVIGQAFQFHPRILEIGTFMGSTARGLIAMTGGMITCIDNWKDSHHEKAGFSTPEKAFWHVLKTQGADLSAQVTALLSGDSKEIGETWADSIDLLFVDGDHTFHGALSDFRLYSPHLVQGGYCLADDYEMEATRQAIQSFFCTNPDEWEIIRTPNTKKDENVFCARKR